MKKLLLGTTVAVGALSVAEHAAQGSPFPNCRFRAEPALPDLE